MLTRGNAIDYLIDYVQNNIDEEWKETCFNSKTQILNDFFKMVYNLLAEQPYSLFFLINFPNVLVSLGIDSDPTYLQMLEKARS